MMGDIATANPETGAETGIDAAIERLNALDAEPVTEPEDGQPEQAEAKENAEVEIEAEAAPEEAEAAESEADAETEEEVEAEAADEADDADLEEEAPKTYRVKVNGEDRDVSLEDLQKGYMQESDYRQKTMKLSEQERAVQQRQQELEARLEGLVPQLEQQLAGQFSDIQTIADVQNLASSDPVRYVQFKAQQDVLASATQAQAQLRAEREQMDNQQFAAWLETEAKTLAEIVPEAADPETGAAYRKAVGEYAVQSGFPQERLAQMSALEFSVLDRARKWDEHAKAQKSTKAIAKKKVAKAPKVQKPGAAEPVDTKADALKSARNRLKKHGGIDNAVAALEALEL